MILALTFPVSQPQAGPLNTRHAEASMFVPSTSPGQTTSSHFSFPPTQLRSTSATGWCHFLYKMRTPLDCRKIFLPILVVLVMALLVTCSRRADLLPSRSKAQADIVGSCERDAAGRLIVTVTNQGNRSSKATTTSIEFDSLAPVILPTHPLIPGQTDRITFRIPDKCFDPVCHFIVRVDSRGEVRESDEANNVIEGRCLSSGTAGTGG